MFIGRLFIWVFHFFFFPFYFSSDFRVFSFHFCAFRFASDRCTLPQQMQNSKNADTLFCLAPLSLLFLCHSLSISLSLFASRYLSLFPNSTDDKNSLYYLPHVPYSVISRKLWLNAGSRKKRSKNASLALDSSMYKQFGTGFVTGE
jgi:hypothetical protein